MIHPNAKKSIAVKLVIEKDLSDGEINVWPNICHRNILPLLGFNYVAPTNTFIFMTDKCPASLDQKFGEAEFIFDLKSFDRAVMWIRDILRGISHLHEKKFAHMYIKTNYVLISADDRASVIDFGSIVSSEVPTSRYVSPIPYRPPETYTADGSWAAVNGIKYDCWTIGLLCIRVFTRVNFYQEEPPVKNFWSKKMYPLLFDVLQKGNFTSKMKFCFPRSKNCSLDVDAVLCLIKSCLNLDPQKRITVKEALNQRLFGGEAFYELKRAVHGIEKLISNRLRD